jgi:hypothetical protein
LVKLWYVGTVISFSLTFLKFVNKITFAFLWKTTEWIARRVLYRSKEQHVTTDGANSNGINHAPLIDHFDGSIVNAGNADAGASLIDLSDTMNVDTVNVASIVVDSENLTALVSDASDKVVGSMPTFNDIVSQMQTPGTSSVDPG